MKTMKILTTAAALFVLGLSVHAEETPSVDEIIDQANKAAYYSDDDGRATVKMTITDPQGRTREREFNIGSDNRTSTEGMK